MTIRSQKNFLFVNGPFLLMVKFIALWNFSMIKTH